MNTSRYLRENRIPLPRRESRVPVPGRQGLTIIELLAVVSVIAILAGLLMPALSKAKSKIGSVKCLNNLKQLQICWQMYVGDFNDRVPLNNSENVNGIWRSSADSWIGRSSALYDTDTKAIQEGLLFKYDYNRVTAVYRCPADKSKVRTQNDQASEAPLRTRSYSMSSALGGNYATNKEPPRILRSTEIQNPVRLFVFVDEHEDSIDDAHFLTWPYPANRWVNMPADRHAQAGSFSFADGHTELWHWRVPKTFKPKESYWKSAANPADLADLRQMQTGVPLAPPGWIPPR